MNKRSKKEDIKSNFRESLSQVANELVSSVNELMRKAKTEPELQIGFEKILEKIQKALDIEIDPKYGRTNIYGKRPDAIHGGVTIEYEPPRSFSSKRNIQHAYNQLVDDYLPAESKHLKLSQLVGVGFDGKQIFFVQYQGKESKTIDKAKFIIRGPDDFNPETARTFLTYLRSLARLPLTAEHLAEKFGPKSKIAQMAVSAFADALEHWGDAKARDFYNEWKRLFGIVYGEQFGAQQAEEVQMLSRLYSVGKETDFQELLFSVHTYFALLMKFIAAELLFLKETAFASSFSYKLTHSTKDELKSRLLDIEEGGIYAKRGITNFLEGDFFRWYLDAFSPRLEEAIREITRGLSEFEPATTTIDPESTRDLLKKLYQYLVPKEIRHRLGEYYTPDWLAELVLNEVGYDGNIFKRVLDPACGSGTFLVLAIQKAKAYGQSHKEDPLKTAKRIVANIWGFDLNPLAVIASRTNYLFALGDLVQKLESFEIPVYLADSILWPERLGQRELEPVGGAIQIHTSIQTFFVPEIWVKGKRYLMEKAAPLVEEMAKKNYSVSEAMERLKEEGLAFPPYEQVVQSFYEEILKLEKESRNGIWARFLKNAFAPMTGGKFDFVVGNPPWIRWDYLSKEYRKATLQLWKDYGLFSLKGFETRLGGGKKDFSMLFTYASADYYLKNGDKLGFLITQEVFKSKGAGEGFRRFRLRQDGEPLEILKAHDLVTVQPFESAANKTGAIILEKGKETSYPVPYFVWEKRKGAGKIPTDKTLEEVLPLLQKKKLFAEPIGSAVGSWRTTSAEERTLTGIEGKNYYKAILGANPNPYGIFWLEIKQVLSNGKIIIRNLTEEGKKDIETVQETIETDLVYPAIRGSDIDRWGTNPEIYMLVVQDPKTRSGYPEETMKKKWSRTFGYLVRFKDELLSRALYKKYHEHAGNPFYSQFNISEETFFRYKVVWKAMSNDIYATVISTIKTPIGYKVGIPLHTTAFFGVDNEAEAHYLCAIINSKLVRDFIKSFSSAGRGFGTPSVMKHVGISKFDPKNELHQKLSQISKTLHEQKVKGDEEKIAKLEKENDETVKKLFGIK